MAIRIAPAFAVHPGEWLRAKIIAPNRLNVTNARVTWASPARR